MKIIKGILNYTWEVGEVARGAGQGTAGGGEFFDALHFYDVCGGCAVVAGGDFYEGVTGALDS